jgi:hypothetical protein
MGGGGGRSAPFSVLMSLKGQVSAAHGCVARKKPIFLSDPRLCGGVGGFGVGV